MSRLSRVNIRCRNVASNVRRNLCLRAADAKTRICQVVEMRLETVCQSSFFVKKSLLYTVRRGSEQWLNSVGTGLLQPQTRIPVPLMRILYSNLMKKLASLTVVNTI